MLKVKMPCLVTALSELAEPRYMSVRGIVDAYQQEITVWGFDDLKNDLNPEWIGLKGSPTNVYKSFSPPVKGAGMMMEGADKATVEKLVSILNDKHII